MIFANLCLGQGIADKYPSIFERAKQLEKKKGYETVELKNEEFLDQMGEGGGSLTGYFQKEDLVKMEARIFTSLGIQAFHFYFTEGDLFLINETFEQFRYNPEIDKIDHSKTEKTFNGNYIFRNNQLIEFETLGHNRFEDDGLNPGEVLLEEANRYRKLLKEKK